jgi:putative membrane protein
MEQTGILEPRLSAVSNRNAVGVILGLSAVVVGFLFWLIYFHDKGMGSDHWSRWLPAVNAALNTTAASLIVGGLVAIRRRMIRTHVVFMVLATACSALFLVSYIIYHSQQGDSRFLGTGWIRPVYFFILITHIVLSVVVVPMILSTLFFSLTRRWEAHRRTARWTYPIWLYVSVTGVLVYLFLRWLNPASA